MAIMALQNILAQQSDFAIMPIGFYNKISYIKCCSCTKTTEYDDALLNLGYDQSTYKSSRPRGARGKKRENKALDEIIVSPAR